VGREFKFPFDLALDATQPIPAGPLPDAGTSVLEHIKHTSQDVDFARQVVALVIEDRRTAQRDRVNECRSAPSFVPNDLVLVRVQVQSNAELNSHQTRGPFRVISHSSGSCRVVPTHQPESNPISCPGHMLSPVPAGILPCSPIDSPDFRCLNHGHAPLPHPLKRQLHIEQHNEVWFSDLPPSARPSHPARTTQPDLLIDSPDPSPFPSLASVDSLPSVAVDPSLAPAPAPLPDDLVLVLPLASSSDKLFVISHLPAGAARPRWCLVRVDSALTDLDPDCVHAATSGTCHVQFLLQNPSDKSMSHPLSLSWPQRNRFTLSPLDGVMEFGAIQFVSPNRTPDPAKFVAWSIAVPLSDPKCHLLGPFSFKPCLLASDRPSVVAPHHWDSLFSFC
jgi:hypothetical protein